MSHFRHIVNCNTCKKSFNAQRSTARFCSDRCRVRMARLKKKWGRVTLSQLQRDIDKLLDVAPLCKRKNDSDLRLFYEFLASRFTSASASVSNGDTYFRWRCDICGQIAWADNPPHYCHYCSSQKKFAGSRSTYTRIKD